MGLLIRRMFENRKRFGMRACSSTRLIFVIFTIPRLEEDQELINNLKLSWRKRI